jgi:hypothetical protein
MSPNPSYIFHLIQIDCFKTEYFLNIFGCCGVTAIASKGKVFPVHAIRHAGGVKVEFHSFLTSVLDGEEWLTLRPGRLAPKERTPVPIA